MDTKSVFPKIKGLSGLEMVLITLLIIAAWIAVSMGLALCVHYPLTWFGANWSEYWGWVILIGSAPAMRTWLIGR